MKNTKALNDFFKEDIEPKELAKLIDLICFEFPMQTLKNNEQMNKETLEGIFYLKALGEALKACT